jgi:hypothetical protein
LLGSQNEVGQIINVIRAKNWENNFKKKTYAMYRKPPTISPGLIYFRKRFLMGLYKGGLIYGWAYTWTIFCVSNKQVRHIQVGHKQLSSDYWAYINWGTYIRGAYIRGGLYLERCER